MSLGEFLYFGLLISHFGLLVSHFFRYHRKEMAIGLGRHRPTSVERVLVLLVESGVLFCLLQVMYWKL